MRAIAGTDEAGRGPLAGPVIAAAVILTVEQRAILLSEGLRDSKKLSEAARERLFEKMLSLGVAWAAQAASPKMIDEMNILYASLWAMKRSVERLPLRPDIVLVDGNTTIPGLAVKQKCVIKGDEKVPAVAAASIAAKVLRDRAMAAFDKIFPLYGFTVHKGYPTAAHKAILSQLGPCPIHRRTFKGVVRPVL